VESVCGGGGCPPPRHACHRLGFDGGSDASGLGAGIRSHAAVCDGAGGVHAACHEPAADRRGGGRGAGRHGAIDWCDVWCERGDADRVDQRVPGGVQRCIGLWKVGGGAC